MTPPVMLSASIRSAASELRTSMNGTVLLTRDTRPGRSRRAWTAAAGRRPAIVARCHSTQDVVEAVRVARRHELPLSVRGGGSGGGGSGVPGGGLLIDLAHLRGVIVHTGAAMADAQGGVSSGDLVTAAHRQGLALVTGATSQAAMAAVALGGGYGPLTGTHGLALDNLLAAKVVLADGTHVRVSENLEPDLFWALRGGGGTFGVVTEMRLRLHPIRSVLAGVVRFDAADAPAVLHGYQELLAEAPDQLTVTAAVVTGSGGAPETVLLPTWNGDPTEGQPYLDRLQKLGTPIGCELGLMPVTGALELLERYLAGGGRSQTWSRRLADLSEDAAGSILAAATRVSGSCTTLALRPFHGAAARVPLQSTAWGVRQEHLLLEIRTARDPATAGDSETSRRWAGDLAQSLLAHALPGPRPGPGPLEPAGGRVPVARGAQASRLRRLKQRYDPEQVFGAGPGPALVPA